MIDTARLTEKLCFQTQIVSKNSIGESVSDWVTTLVIYASLTKQKGNQSYSDGENTYTDVTSFFCRYISLDAMNVFSKKGNRILYKGNAYKIINFTTVPRNENTIIDCTTTF